MKSPQIAIFTPQIYYSQLSKAATALGCEVSDFSYTLNDRSSIIKKYYSSLNSAYAYKNQGVQFNKLLEKFLKKADDFEVVIFFKGQHINKDLKDLLRRSKVKKIFWSTDSLVRVPHVNCHKVSDINFFQDKGDCKRANDYWLPLGIDTQFFYPSEDKPIDIAFIGRMKSPNYSIRYSYLKRLCLSNLDANYKISVVSNLSNKQKKELKFRKRNITYYHKLPYDQFAQIIRNAKVVVNIHQDDGIKPINPLFYSIPYCKTIQVVDGREYYGEALDKKLFISSDIENFIPDLKGVMKDYNNYYSKLLQQMNLLEQHTMENRLKYILSFLNL